MKRIIIFTPREMILSAIAFYLIASKRDYHLFVYDIPSFFCFFLLLALVDIIKKNDMPILEKGMLIFSIIWTILVVGCRIICGTIDLLEMIVPIVPIALMVILFVMLITYMVLYKKNKLTSENVNKLISNSMSDFITMELLVVMLCK